MSPFFVPRLEKDIVRLISLLKESSEHTVRAMVRKQEQADSYEKQGVETACIEKNLKMNHSGHSSNGRWKA